MAGDTSRIKMWWFKKGKGCAFSAALIAWGAVIVVPYVVLYSRMHFNANNPMVLAFLCLVWAAGAAVLNWIFPGSGLPERKWRPRAAVLAEWAKDHGGAKDPTPAQITLHRGVVRAAASDELRIVWAARAAGDGYPIRLLLVGVSGKHGVEATQRTILAAGRVLPRMHYTLMIADTGVEMPWIVIAAPRSDQEDLLHPGSSPRIEFESAEFNDTWEVRCSDVSTGHKVFDPRTMEILLELEATDIRIVWDGTSVAVAREGSDVDAAELDRWLALIDRMVRNGRLIGRSG